MPGRSGPTFPTRLNGGGRCRAIEDRVYVFGGVHGESESDRSYLKTIQIYDTAKDEWTTEHLPVRMYCPAGGEVGRRGLAVPPSVA